MKMIQNTDTLIVFGIILYTTLILALSQQITLMGLIFGVIGASTLAVYITIEALCSLFNLNRISSIGASGCFWIALLYFPILVVWNRCMFSPDLINFSYIAFPTLVGIGLIYRLICFIIRRKGVSFTTSYSKADTEYVRNKILILFLKNLALSLVIILPVQFFSGAPFNKNWGTWDLSEYQWAENLFSMSCMLWLIVALAYFLGINRTALTSKRIQATMAAIFLICGLATTLLFKNAILVWSTLAAPIIYLLLQNHHSKTNDRDLSHSS